MLCNTVFALSRENLDWVRRRGGVIGVEFADSEPGNDFLSAGVDEGHHGDLSVALGERGLVDADSVDPEGEGGSLGAEMVEGQGEVGVNFEVVGFIHEDRCQVEGGVVDECGDVWVGEIPGVGEGGVYGFGDEGGNGEGAFEGVGEGAG